MSDKSKKENDDLFKLISDLREENSYPDENFEDALKEKFLKKSLENLHSENLFFRLNFMARIRLLFVALAFLGVLGIAFSAFFISKDDLSDSQIIQRVNSANSYLQSTIGEPLTINESYGSFLFDSGITTLNQKLTEGDRYFVCENFPNWREKRKFFYQPDAEIPEFFSREEKYDENGVLTELRIDAEGSYILYLGGKYAVKMPTMSKVDDNTFGSEVHILSEFNVPSNSSVSDLGDYYLITWESDLDCEGYDNSSEKFIFQINVDKESYLIKEISVYIGSFEDENLLFSIKNEIESKSVELEDYRKYFEFAYEIELREFEIPEIDYDNHLQIAYDQLAEYLLLNPDAILVPNDKNWVLVGATKSVVALENNNAGYDFFFDREFYPEGVIGDNLLPVRNYQTPVNSGEMGEINFTYTNPSIGKLNNLNIQVFQEQYWESALLFFNLKEEDLIEFDSLYIDGNLVDAYRFYQPVDEGIILENPELVGVPLQEMHGFIFEHNEYIYAMIVENYVEIDRLSFSTKNFSNEEEINNWINSFRI